MSSVFRDPAASERAADVDPPERLGRAPVDVDVDALVHVAGPARVGLELHGHPLDEAHVPDPPHDLFHGVDPPLRVDRPPLRIRRMPDPALLRGDVAAASVVAQALVLRLAPADALVAGPGAERVLDILPQREA